MADSKSSTKARTADLQLIRDLIKAAEADTVYRDLYLQRAAERLELSLSRAEYERLKAQPATLDQLTQETREAVRRQNWAKVQELTASATNLCNMLADKQSELKLAEEVYGAAEVVVDPFSSAVSIRQSSGSFAFFTILRALVAGDVSPWRTFRSMQHQPNR
jgi:hypothetical protein